MFPHSLNTFLGENHFCRWGFAAGVQIKIKPVVALFWMDRYQFTAFPVSDLQMEKSSVRLK